MINQNNQRSQWQLNGFRENVSISVEQYLLESNAGMRLTLKISKWGIGGSVKTSQDLVSTFEVPLEGISEPERRDILKQIKKQLFLMVGRKDDLMIEVPTVQN